MSDGRGRSVFGAILILLGAIFLLPNLNQSYFHWDNIWPLFIVLGGLAFLIGWAVAPKDNEGLAFVGTGALLVGVFLGLFVWGVLRWGEMGVWWPAFPLIGGVAFLALWGAGKGKDAGVLVPAFLGILTGLVAFAFTSGALEPAIAAKWWPAALILLGLIIIARRLAARK
jgi:hypothetical protein